MGNIQHTKEEEEPLGKRGQCQVGWPGAYYFAAFGRQFFLKASRVYPPPLKNRGNSSIDSELSNDIYIYIYYAHTHTHTHTQSNIHACKYIWAMARCASTCGTQALKSVSLGLNLPTCMTVEKLFIWISAIKCEKFLFLLYWVIMRIMKNYTCASYPCTAPQLPIHPSVPVPR